MNTKCNGSVLALALAGLMASTVLAGQSDERAAANEAGQEVMPQAVQQADSSTTEPAAAPEPEAAPVEAEPSDEGIEPPPEPQAVVKTKTKSNQSND